MTELITVKRTVTAVALTASHWELYDLPGRDDAAKRLNAAFAEAVNASATAADALKAFTPALRRESNFGAADSEGWATAEWAFHAVYGD